MKLITRVKMRRAYNSGDWEKARFYANKLITKKGENGLAKSVIVRSYWNQGDLEKLGELLTVWQDSELDFIREKYEKVVKEIDEKKKNAIGKYESPCPDILVDWNPDNLISNYFQEEARLWLKTPKTWVYWDMPSAFDLNKTSHSLLELAAELLLRPWEKSTKMAFSKKRDFGEKCRKSAR